MQADNGLVVMTRLDHVMREDDGLVMILFGRVMWKKYSLWPCDARRGYHVICIEFVHE